MTAIRNLFLVLAAAAAPLTAGAAPITVGYGGGVFGLEALGVNGNTLTVRYSADLTNFVGVQVDQRTLAAVGFKLNDGYSSASLFAVSANLNSADWYLGKKQLAANGCPTGTQTGYLCAQYGVAAGSDPTTGVSTGLNVVGGPVYYWDFNITFAATPSLAMITTGLPIKALFLNADGQQNGLMSCTTGNNPVERNCTGGDEDTDSDVPEPGTLALLGLGLIGLRTVRRGAR